MEYRRYWCPLLLISITFTSTLLPMKVSGTVNNTELIDLYQTLCPFSELCSRSAAARLQPGNVPCCTDCSCSDHCHILNNCCPDKEATPPSRPTIENRSVVNQEFQLTSEYFGCHPNTVKYWRRYETTYKYYYMIDKCPTGSRNTNQTVTDLCENVETEDVRSYVPVTDVHNNITYRNRYCSTCHNVSGVLAWSSEVISSFNVFEGAHRYNLPFPDTLHELIDSIRVRVVLIPRTNVATQRCTNTRLVDKCNVTGLWNQWSDSVEDRCMNSPLLPYRHIYRNVFCALCNIKLQFIVCSLTDSKTSLTAFTSILQLEPETSSSQTNNVITSSSSTKDDCNPGYVMDTYQEQCRQEFCPTRKTMVRGTCINLLIVRDVTFYMTLKLETISDFIEMEDNKTKVKAAQAFVSSLSYKHEGVTILLHYILQTPQSYQGTPYMAVLVRVLAKGIQDFDVFDWTLARLQEGFAFTGLENINYKFHVSLHNTLQIKKALQWSFTDLQYNFELTPLYDLPIDKKENIGFSVTALMFCTQVRLNESEVVEVFNDHIRAVASNKSFFGNEYTKVFLLTDREFYFHVCTDVYLNTNQVDVILGVNQMLNLGQIIAIVTCGLLFATICVAVITVINLKVCRLLRT